MTRSIGAGLAPARVPRTIREGDRIHVVGIAGAGASAAAILAARSGAIVTGCDPGGPSPYTDAVEAARISIEWSHDAAHVMTRPRPYRLAVTKALTAIDPDNPELAAARDVGIPVESWQQLIADAALGRTLIGVAGTHGKSTTAGWLVHVLVSAGADPSAFVGALLPSSVTGGPPATARWGTGQTFVVEADEYAGNFDPYWADIKVLTSAEWDHPDVFADSAAVASVFERWLGSPPDEAVIVANAADPTVSAIVDRLQQVWALDAPVTIVRYGLDEGRTVANSARLDLVGRITATPPDGTTLEIAGLDGPGSVATVVLATAGHHNAANALAVAGAARAAGLDTDDILRGLATFSGVGRRLERKGEAAGVVVYDDYAHHPTAIRETLRAIRQREPGRPVWAVYEPLTYHRTAALLDDFAEVLATADSVAIAEIWAGRDPDTTITSARALADATLARRPGMIAVAPGNVEATATWLARAVHGGDAVLVMGGGRSYRIAELLLEALAVEERR